MSSGDEMPLNAIIGAELAAVVFVRDYLQFNFEVPFVILNAHADPVVQVTDRRFTKDTSGWRDAVCALIGHQITNFEIESGTEFRIVFDNTATLSIPLDTDEIEPAVFCFSRGNDPPEYVIIGP
jgi:hypothetical protein